MSVLSAGYNIIINKKLGAVSTPLYPITSTDDVMDAQGNTLTSLLGGIAGKNYVPDFSQETVSNLRFLRNDNTWATIQDASTSQKGVVQLTDVVDPATADGALALNQVGAKALNDKFANYVALAQLGISGGTADTKVATLDANGKVPAAQLPSYVDDVIEGYYDATAGKFYEDQAKTTEITPETGKIYVDLAGKRTYRWGGSAYAEISESLAIGTTAGTAYEGSAGQALADKLADIDEGANKVEASATNGNIVISGTETTVFTPDQASAAQAGYMSAADFSKLAAISAEAKKVEASTTNGNIKIDGVETTVFTPDVVDSSKNGYMTNTMYNKFVNMAEVAISETAPTFSDATSDGLWFEVVSQYTPATP